MKVLLIQPPVRVDIDPCDIPAGIAILSSIAIEEGHQVALLDLNSSRPIPSLRDSAKQIAVEKWDIIAIGGLSSMYKDIKKLLYISRKINPDALIVAGGGFITYMPQKMMEFNPEIDIAVMGEGEETWREVLRTYDSKQWNKVKGICYRQDDTIVFNEPRPLIPNLDVIPYPAYDLLDMDSYFSYSGSMWFPGGFWNAKRRINFVTERGCPRQCTFCTHNGMNRWDQLALYGDKKVKEMDKEFEYQAITRFFSPEYIVKHVKMLYEKYKIDYICLLDENLTAYPKRVHEFCDLWIQEGLHKKVKLGTSGDAPSISPEIVKHMKEAGFVYISVGGESGSDKVLLKDIGKGVTSADNQRAIDTMRNNGVEPHMTFMVGNPNEDINDVLETVKFLKHNKATVNPFICTPYPGTKIFMDHEDSILAHYDEKLELLRNNKISDIPKDLVAKWKNDALEKFLLSLNNATDYSCTVSQKFDFGDLIAIKHFMNLQDYGKLLKLAHMRNWSHDEKWNKECPVCLAENQVSVELKPRLN